MNPEAPDPEHGKPGRIILLVVICVALLGAIGYNFWSSQQNKVTPVTRTAADFIVTWRCLGCKHEVDGRAGIGPRTCPSCGENDMYVCIRHACSQHGVQPVAFQYDDAMEPIQLKIADQPWVPYADEDYNINTHCPRCGQIMFPAESPRPAQATSSELD